MRICTHHWTNCRSIMAPGANGRVNVGHGLTGMIGAKQDAYIDWALDPERVGTQAEWCRAHSTVPSTVYRWKHDDPYFQQELDQRMREKNVSPDRIQSVIDALFSSAIDSANRGQVAAARLLLEYLELFTPTSKRVTERKTTLDASQLSDDELKALINEEAQRQLRQREGVSSG